ncbi:hypothetical protein BGW42_006498 [Actinomortierella wolfii]|nr:hypothetical protein BGW42_006498 [Actinomortierella wolfii]
MPPAPHLTAIPTVPVTEERKPFEFSHGALPLVSGTADDDDANRTLWNLGMARASGAETPTHPEGTTKDNWASKHRNKTVLQQHCEFFDPDGDGVVWPSDTFLGFRRLGYNLVWCVLAMYLINGFLSYATNPSWIPDPFFRVYLTRIHKDKHGSDSATYDPEGRFVPQHFEDIFAKYATSKDPEGLYWSDVVRMLKGQRVAADPFGWFAAFFEWFATYLLLWPEDGIMRKDDIRRVYDGSIFFERAARRSKEAEERRQRRYAKLQKANPLNKEL